MIHLRTGIAVALAGTGTLIAGTIAGQQPAPSPTDRGVPGPRLAALGIGMGGMLAGVLTALTGPGTSLRPLGGTLAAAVGGLLVGQHVLGRLGAGN